VDIFGDQTGNLRCWVTDDIEKRDNIGTSSQILENLDFTLDFLLLDWFEHLDDAFLLGYDIYTFENLYTNITLGVKVLATSPSRTSEYFPRPTFRTIS